MGATVDQIEAHIDGTRAELGIHLEELERKVGALADWRQHFDERPWLFVGAAFVGGALLAAWLGPEQAEPREVSPRPWEPVAGAPHTGRVLETWEAAKGALVGVAIDRVKQYMTDLIPGFAEQFEMSERRMRGA